jgi:hypothetical protein
MKDKTSFIGMNKSSIVSQLKSLWDSIVDPKIKYDMHGLVEENKLSWFFRNLANIGNSHFPYQYYPKPEINNGIFKMQRPSSDRTTVALLSDWASNTFESELVARQASGNDYSIHLGDTYYVGNKKEIADNFNTDHEGSWPYGTLGSFAMLGNHEMYSSGRSYFQQLLPYMGNFVKEHDKPQQASFFCLENDYWRIIGLDTGYYSLKGWLGIKPNLDLDLHDQQKEWLENTVKIKDDKRGIIILSHHQCFSAFEEEFPNPGKYISSLIEPGRDILWLWGHEHWFSVYGPNKLENGSNVFARCVGNSGMPVEINRKNELKVPRSVEVLNPINRNLTLYDDRKREVINGNIALGYNGFVVLELEADKLNINYYDDNDKQEKPRKILQEEWKSDITTGQLKGIKIDNLTEKLDSKLRVFSNDINNAIGKSSEAALIATPGLVTSTIQ